MKKYNIAIAFVCLLGSMNIFSLYNISAANLNPRKDIVSETDTSICLQVKENFLQIDFVNPSVFRIRMNNENNFPEGGMVRYGIVNTACSNHKVKVSNERNFIELSTDSARLNVDKRDGSVKLFDNKGNLVTGNDQPPAPRMEDGFELSFQLTDNERLYGFGDESREQLNKRGHKNQIMIKNRDSYAPVPYVMSTGGWGLFLNTTMIHSFDAGATIKNRLSFSSEKGIIDYYLISGSSMLNMLDKYTDITGKPHLLPKWGYGMTWVCDERGVRARDVLYEAYEFRRHDIPCDVIGLEPDWMEKHYDTSTKKEWSKERFHIPFWLRHTGRATFADALREMGFRMSLWLCTDYDFSEYEEYLLQNQRGGGSSSEIQGTREKRTGQNEVVILDTLLGDKMITQKADQEKDIEPWFDHLEKFVDDGASMFKLDGAGQVTLKLDPERRWANGMDDYEMINLYPLLYSKQMHYGFKEHTGRRAMIFTVGGYSGIQRFSATWAGDTGGGPGPMVSLINHGFSGHSNVCTDMQTHSPAGIHFGFFQPLTQVLGWHMYVQPWFLGEKSLAMFKDYSHIRYSLVPYIYSTAHVASEKAIPMMRALSLIYPDDLQCDKYVNQYLFGDALLVSAFDSVVYLPEGEWIDYWTGKHYDGRQEIASEFPEDRGGPLFIKAGSIIPTQKVRSNIGTSTPDEIIWEIYPKGKSEFTLYEDDGESYKYLDGNIARTTVECIENNSSVEIIIHPRTGRYDNMPSKRVHSLKIHCPGKPEYENKEYSAEYDEDNGVLKIDNIEDTGREISILVKYSL
jgi:alpha-glucosidase (family GH31 glycosyl hydrolase)